MCVQQHCLSPLSKGLFHKAVMCSGGGVNGRLTVTAPDKKYDFWRMIMEKCGAETLEQFRKVPADLLFKVWDENRTAINRGGSAPCIDGELIVGVDSELFKAGKQHYIPYMIGTTGRDIIPPILYSMAKDWCKKQPEPSYLWFFDRNLPGDDKGSWHSSDLWYWFGTLDNCWRPFTEKDKALSEEMLSRLCAFAKNSVPDAEGYINWQSGGEKALVFSDEDTKEGDPSVIKSWITMFTNKAPGE